MAERQPFRRTFSFCFFFLLLTGTLQPTAPRGAHLLINCLWRMFSFDEMRMNLHVQVESSNNIIHQTKHLTGRNVQVLTVRETTDLLSPGTKIKEAILLGGILLVYERFVPSGVPATGG